MRINSKSSLTIWLTNSQEAVKRDETHYLLVTSQKSNLKLSLGFSCWQTGHVSGDLVAVCHFLSDCKHDRKQIDQRCDTRPTAEPAENPPAFLIRSECPFQIASFFSKLCRGKCQIGDNEVLIRKRIKEKESDEQIVNFNRIKTGKSPIDKQVAN